MRRTASEKMEIIRLVEDTDLPVKTTLHQLGVPRSTFYAWYQRFAAEGFDGRVLRTFGLYTLIPLLSWVGGALVERGIDWFMGE